METALTKVARELDLFSVQSLFGFLRWIAQEAQNLTTTTAVEAPQRALAAGLETRYQDLIYEDDSLQTEGAWMKMKWLFHYLRTNEAFAALASRVGTSEIPNRLVDIQTKSTIVEDTETNLRKAWKFSTRQEASCKSIAACSVGRQSSQWV